MNVHLLSLGKFDDFFGIATVPIPILISQQHIQIKHHLYPAFFRVFVERFEVISRYGKVSNIVVVVRIRFCSVWSGLMVILETESLNE